MGDRRRAEFMHVWLWGVMLGLLIAAVAALAGCGGIAARTKFTPATSRVAGTSDEKRPTRTRTVRVEVKTPTPTPTPPTPTPTGVWKGGGK